MTANQLKAQENELKREELEEKKKMGKSERFKNYLSPFTNAVSSAGSVLKGIGSFYGKKNDPSWYNLDKQLVNDVCQLPYGKPIGIAEKRPHYTEDGTSGSGLTGCETMPFPGIMRIEYSATVGDGSASESDAINVAMRNVYSFVRHANSGSRNYDAPDLMQYMLTMDSIYSLIAHCTRAYSIALTAKSSNRYWPTKMLDAAGFVSSGSDSIVNNLAQFRAEINMAIQKASIFNVPAKFPYFNRHIWLNSNVFKDGEYHRSRNYVFVPNVYYGTPDINGVQHGIKYFAVDPNTKLIIGTENWLDPTSSTVLSDVRHMTYTEAVALLKYLIDQATRIEDYGIMSGDILKAFGDNLFKLQSIDEDFHFDTTYSPEVLTQIQGISILPGEYRGACIAQTANGIIYQGGRQPDTAAGSHQLVIAPGIHGFLDKVNSGNITKGPGLSKVLINMYKDQVTPDDNMVATRFSNIYENGLNDYVTWPTTGGGTQNQYLVINTAKTCASEIVDGVVLFCNPGNIASSVINAYAPFRELFSDNGMRITGWGYEIDIASSGWSEILYRVIQVINCFEWAPRIFITCYTTSTTGIRNAQPVYDNMELANYIYIGQSEIQQMHAVALLSLFAVPLLGNTARKY